MSTNIYLIKCDEYNTFLSCDNLKKVIVFYRKDCKYCSQQIENLRKLAKEYYENVEYAICDVTGNIKFCINNDIVSLPTTKMYVNNKLVCSYDASFDFESLKEKVMSL